MCDRWGCLLAQVTVTGSNDVRVHDQENGTYKVSSTQQASMA